MCLQWKRDECARGYSSHEFRKCLMCHPASKHGEWMKRVSCYRHPKVLLDASFYFINNKRCFRYYTTSRLTRFDSIKSHYVGCITQISYPSPFYWPWKVFVLSLLSIPLLRVSDYILNRRKVSWCSFFATLFTCIANQINLNILLNLL